METRVVLVGVLLALMAFTEANKRQRRNVEDLQQFNNDLTDLQLEFGQTKETLKQLSGFLNAIGFGGDTDPCGNDPMDPSWSLVTPSTCVKLLNGLLTMDETERSCYAEFKPSVDIEHPQLLSVDSFEKNAAMLRLLEPLSSVTSVWLQLPPTNFSNWAPGSPTQFVERNCIELRNDATNRGQWVDVSCLRKNSAICEKTVIRSYSELVRTQIHYLARFQNLSETLASLADRGEVDASLFFFRTSLQLLERKEAASGDKVVSCEREIQSLKQKTEAAAAVETSKYEDLSKASKRLVKEVRSLKTAIDSAATAGATSGARVATCEREIQSLKQKMEAAAIADATSGAKVANCEREIQSLKQKMEAAATADASKYEHFLAEIHGFKRTMDSSVVAEERKHDDLSRRLIAAELKIQELEQSPRSPRTPKLETSTVRSAWYWKNEASPTTTTESPDNWMD